MEKPISMRINELKETIVNGVNASGISPVILEMIIRDIYNEVKLLAEKQEKEEIKAYQKGLAEEKANAEKLAAETLDYPDN